MHLRLRLRLNAEKLTSFRLSSSTSQLFYNLTELLHPEAPAWLRERLTETLSLLPLRPNGVRDTVRYFAIRSYDQNMIPTPSKEDVTPMKALNLASRLFSSVPRSMAPDIWFTDLSTQLLSLLDGSAGPEIAKAAGYIIGTGILGKKVYGKPDGVGWKLFAKPILSNIDPSLGNPEMLAPINQMQSPFDSLVSETELDTAISRLDSLLSSHPNPNLTKRFLAPLYLPLWALLCYSAKRRQSKWYSRVSNLIRMFFKMVAGTEQMIKIGQNLLFDGRRGWVFAPGDGGGIEVRHRSNLVENASPFMERVSDIDLRAKEYIKLLRGDLILDHELGEVFLSISKSWLLRAQSSSETPKTLEASDTAMNEQVVLRKIANIKLIQNMLDLMKDKIASNSSTLLELIEQILSNFCHEDEELKANEAKKGMDLHSSLRSIVSHDEQVPSDETSEHANERQEIVSIALSLLSNLLTSEDYLPSPSQDKALKSIQSSLTRISQLPAPAPPTLTTTASNLSALLNITITAPLSSAKPTAPEPDPLRQDRKTYTLAQNYLMDELPPVRGQGLSLLTSLIKAHSPILDIPSTTILLISMLQDSEDYVYLSTITTLGELAVIHPQTVIKHIVESYADREERMQLDQRLRIGETLLRVVEKLGDLLVGDAARWIGEGCLSIAGRRGKRPKEEADKRRRLETIANKNEEAAKAWGGEVPNLYEDEEEEEDQRADEILKIVEGWEGRDGEEDIRIRASALLIFGKAVETNVVGIGPARVNSGVDLAMSVLTLESQPGTEILRRAAVLLINSLITALDGAAERGKKLSFGLAGENLEAVLRVLGWVYDTDGDELVRGHAASVINALEARHAGYLTGLPDNAASGPLIERAEDVLARRLADPDTDSKHRPVIEEIE